jgi:biopolymer transport protein ExbD
LAKWDIFHGDRLEVQRGLSSAEVRDALARGELRDNDLIRPAGSNVRWAPLDDVPALLEADEAEEKPPVSAEPPPAKSATPTKPAKPPAPEPPSIDVRRAEFPPVDASLEFGLPSLLSEDLLPRPATTEDVGVESFGRGTTGDLNLKALFDDDQPNKEAPLEAIIDDEDEEAPLEAIIDEDDDDDEELSRFSLDPASVGHAASKFALPPVPPQDADWRMGASDDEDEEEVADPLDEDEAAAEFTLSRSAADKVEELDLAAMVDVAFQLVLFFLVTATTILYKTLEVPKPAADAPPGAVTQGQGKSLDDLARDYILVEIDPQGVVKVDHEPAPSDMQALAERLRAARTQTGRTKMLLSADFTTMHRSAVTAYDAANEIGLGIAIARPSNAGAAAPPPPPAPEPKKDAPG